MGLNKQNGNMYLWVSHTHTHLGGKCPHECAYCSIQSLQKRFPELPYSGPLRLKEAEFSVPYGSGKTIFEENCNDLFAADVPLEWIERIMAHCCLWPVNDYVFQTKNPLRVVLDSIGFPPRTLFGCTVETNRENDRGNAPSRIERLLTMMGLKGCGMNRTFITIEPVMDFDVDEFSTLIIDAEPSFVNIGADSKNSGLPEPSAEKIEQLIGILVKAGIEIREKHNLERIIGEKKP